MHVEVLLSTYNGEPWFAAQLDSVLAQTHADLAVTVRRLHRRHPRNSGRILRQRPPRALERGAERGSHE